MLELPNFDRMTQSTMQFESRNKNFLGDVIDRKFDDFRRPRVANFAETIKLQPCFLKQPLKTQAKLKKLEITYQNAIYVCISWNNKSCWFPVKNADLSNS